MDEDVGRPNAKTGAARSADQAHPADPQDDDEPGWADSDFHPDCAFCEGREAAHRGGPAEANPYRPTTTSPRSPEYYDTDFGL